MPAGRFKTTVANPDDFQDVKEYARYLAGLMASNFGEMNWLFGNLDSVNIKNLTADKIVAGTILASLVTIRGKNGDKFFQFDENGIVANNGDVNTMQFDLATGLLTIVSALIQSATGYPKIELNSAANLIGAYASATNYIYINPFQSSTPTIGFVDGVNKVLMNFALGIFDLIASNGSVNITAQSGNLGLYATGSGNVRFSGWDNILSNTEGRTLKSELNSLLGEINDLKSRVSALENP